MPMIDVVGAQAGTQQLLEKISFLIGCTGRADTPIDSAPLSSLISRSRPATRVSASSQLAGCNSPAAPPIPARRMSGVRRRCGLLTWSRSQRPRSQSHPLSTSSLVREYWRSTLSTRTSTRTLQPTAQLPQILAVCRSSHGRETKR